MVFTCLFVFLLCVSTVLSDNIEDATLSVRERVSFLKYVFKKELHEQLKGSKAEPHIVNEHYDYVDLSHVAITPINDDDDRKQNDKFKLRQLKTKRTTKPPAPKLSRPSQRQKKPIDFAQSTTPKVKSIQRFQKKNIERQQMQVKQSYKMAEREQAGFDETWYNKPMAEFYKQRRLLTGALDTPLQWTHCEDLITPYLTGVQKEITKPLIIGPTHRKVLRLVHLLQTNVSLYTKQDIYSLLYQISNVQIRLFTWDPESMRALFTAISPGKKHSFSALKNGLKRLFKDWHLDFSDLKNLLIQSKVFRPICLPSLQDGSTKSSKGSTYTTKGSKPLKGVEKCSDESEQT